MKSIRRPETNTKISFDLTAPIQPSLGLGGLLFSQTITDFQEALLTKSFDNVCGDYFDYTIDPKLFFLNITTMGKEIEIELNILTGKIVSIACSNGYSGKLQNGFGIGSSIKEFMAKDKSFGFNLDTDWFDRTPFDGLIIYPPTNLHDKCVDAAVYGTGFPDFIIERIELIDLAFAKQQFSEGQLTFAEL